MKPVTALRSRELGLASLLFLLSGATGLAYQVLWFKSFTQLWGNSVLALAAVTSSFLLGLALGAKVLGSFSDSCRRPLSWYGAFEVAIGVWALVVPALSALLRTHVSGLTFGLEVDSTAGALVRGLLTFLCIGPACFLMGGTLPLMVGHFTRSGRTGSFVGWFYAINTFGAALGCYVAGFHVLPALGLVTTNLTAVALNLALGTVALRLGGLAEPALRRERRVSPVLARAAATAETIAFPRVLAATALVGCAALSLQMVWTRQLSLVLGGTTYAFSAVLFVVLLGIALGSLIYDRVPSERLRRPGTMAFFILATMLGVFAGQQLLPFLAQLVGSVRDLRASQVFNASLCVSASVLLELVPALGFGILFPFLVDQGSRGRERAGAALGSIYASNTIATIVGCWMTSVVLIPSLGTAKTVAVAQMLLGAAFLVTVRPSTVAGMVGSLATAGAAAAAIAVAGLELDPRALNSGFHLYGTIPVDRVGKVLYFEEGGTCNVLVTRVQDNVALRVNGKVDASSEGDMTMQLGLGYLPRFVRPEADDVLVIGFGSGVTAGASLLFPGTRVTCCELEPAVLEASRFFREVNHRPLDRPGLTVVHDDGRHFLQAHRRTYDLILSEPSNPWIAGISALFTEEFYETARDRLAEGGILAQWIQTYSLSSEEYAMLLRTLRSVFPYANVVRISEGDSIVLASERPILGGGAELAVAQRLVDSTPAVAEDLDRWFGTSDVAGLLLEHVVLGDAQVDAFVAGAGGDTVHRDSNMRLEFDAPRRLYQSPLLLDELADALVAAIDPAWQIELWRRWESPDSPGAVSGPLADALADVSRLLHAADRREATRRLAAFAGEAGIEHAHFDAMRLTAAGEDAFERESFGATVRGIAAASEHEAHELGVWFWDRKRYGEARAVFEELAALHPRSATALGRFARVLGRVGEGAEADRAFAAALSMDPFNNEVRQAERRLRDDRARAGRMTVVTSAETVAGTTAAGSGQ